jgi:hypothetical protein
VELALAGSTGIDDRCPRWDVNEDGNVNVRDLVMVVRHRGEETGCERGDFVPVLKPTPVPTSMPTAKPTARPTSDPTPTPIASQTISSGDGLKLPLDLMEMLKLSQLMNV